MQSSGWAMTGKGFDNIDKQSSKRLTILSSAAQLGLGLFLGSGSTFTGLNMVLPNAIIHVGPGQPRLMALLQKNHKNRTHTQYTTHD